MFTQTITFFYTNTDEMPCGLYDEPCWQDVECDFEYELDAHQVENFLLSKGVPPIVVNAMLESESDVVGDWALSDYADQILERHGVEFTAVDNRVIFSERYVGKAA